MASSVRARSARATLVAIAVLALCASAFAWAVPSAAAAGESVSASGSGTTAPPCFGCGPGQSFQFSASDDGAGHVTGTFSLSFGSGSVSCLVVSGSSAVIGGSVSQNPGFPQQGPAFVVMWVTDGGPNGAGDTISTFGTFMQPTCSEASTGTPLGLASGDIVVDAGGSGTTGALSIDATGTQQLSQFST